MLTFIGVGVDRCELTFLKTIGAYLELQRPDDAALERGHPCENSRRLDPTSVRCCNQRRRSGHVGPNAMGTSWSVAMQNRHESHFDNLWSETDADIEVFAFPTRAADVPVYFKRASGELEESNSITLAEIEPPWSVKKPFSEITCPEGLAPEL